jgi:hypothetical protein
MRAWPPTTRWRFLASLGMTRMIISMKLDNVGSDEFYNTPKSGQGHKALRERSSQRRLRNFCPSVAQ